MKNDGLLIELVRSYRQLYDTKCPHYHDSISKENAWTDIAENLHSTKYACKKRWNMLRDSYRKAVRKSISARSEQNSEVTTTFKFEKQMKFLLPYFAERQHNSNSTFPVNDQYEEYEGRIKEEEEEEDSFIIPSPMEPFISQEEALSPSLHSEEISRTPSQSCDAVSFIPGHSRSPHNEGNAPALSTVLRNYFESKIQKKQADHLTKFFSAMEGTVRTFPPAIQAEVKCKISQIVFDYEMKTVENN
ncbi:hypothetical protein R5R35_001825 [Gryllus longicercus]|uniref:MADF domain-containing protein n=1 Tax=Gryllus longicercus TaxID=2509291 RepID=A0AAN9W0H0_9ORTH